MQPASLWVFVGYGFLTTHKHPQNTYVNLSVTKNECGITVYLTTHKKAFKINDLGFWKVLWVVNHPQKSL